jgi:hypothetical protein
MTSCPVPLLHYAQYLIAYYYSSRIQTRMWVAIVQLRAARIDTWTDLHHLVPISFQYLITPVSSNASATSHTYMRYVQIKIVWGLLSANEYSLLKVIFMGTKKVVSLTHQPMDSFQKELHGPLLETLHHCDLDASPWPKSKDSSCKSIFRPCKHTQFFTINLQVKIRIL